VNLDHLRIAPAQGELPTAAQHNGLLDQLLRNRFAGFLPDEDKTLRRRHPWKVRVARFTERPGAAFNPDTTWRVDVACGTLNDGLALIPYLREGDPRGWQMPAGFVHPDLAAPSSPWIDRDGCDDLDDPPFLVARELQDFVRIEDRARRGIEDGAFCSAADWELELYRAHVILSATPLVINTVPNLPPPALKRVRLYVSRSLPTAVIAEAGIAFELATLYLLRDPRDPANAQLRPRQRETWPIWTDIVRPGADLPGLIGALGVGAVQTGVGDNFTGDVGGLTDLIADLNAGRLEEILSGSATVEAWTV